MNKKTILGTAQLIQKYGIANKELNFNNKKAFQILNQSLKFGINRWDTSPIYSNSEKLIGNYLYKNNNIDIKISTKLNSLNKSKNYSLKNINLKNHIKKNIMKSMNVMNIEKIDCYFLHDENDYFLYKKEILEILNEFKKSGLINKIGVSFYSSDLAIKAINDKFIDVIQIPVNIFDRLFKEVINLARKNNILVQARSIFLQGLFFLSPLECKLKLPQGYNYVLELYEIAKKNSLKINIYYILD